MSRHQNGAGFKISFYTGQRQILTLGLLGAVYRSLLQGAFGELSRSTRLRAILAFLGPRVVGSRLRPVWGSVWEPSGNLLGTFCLGAFCAVLDRFKPFWTVGPFWAVLGCSGSSPLETPGGTPREPSGKLLGAFAVPLRLPSQALPYLFEGPIFIPRP